MGFRLLPVCDAHSQRPFPSFPPPALRECRHRSLARLGIAVRRRAMLTSKARCSYSRRVYLPDCGRPRRRSASIVQLADKRRAHEMHSMPNLKFSSPTLELAATGR
jgi:hypothetical protein